MITLEVCVDDTAGIKAAVAGGADRIELCAALALGGLTPSAGLIAQAARAPLPVMAMIRPRAGDFIWSETEISAQLAEIAAIRAAGLTGVVIGASLPDGRLDSATLARMVAAARGMEITLHRVIDLTPDPVAAMQLCADLGVRRVLSSGGQGRAVDGIARLQAMQAATADVIVMPGGGVDVAAAATLARELHLREVHASCSSAAPDPADPRIRTFGFQAKDARVTDRTKIRALRQTLDHLSGAATLGCTNS
jgi:copper homeostasis protein